MHTELTPPPSSPHPHPRRLLARIRRCDLLWLCAWVLAIAAALGLTGLAVSLCLPTPPAAVRATSSGIEQAGNELLYRACVREARVRSLPVKPYPQESESISFVHEGKLLVRRTETLEADINDMSVDNGCQVTLHSHVRTETAPSADIAGSMSRMALAQEAGEEAANLLPESAADNGGEAPRCTLERDMALQSHYMLLKLCSVERSPATERPGEMRKKPARLPWRPTT